MENQKPARRPVRKYDKSSGSDIRSRIPDGKPAGRSFRQDEGSSDNYDGPKRREYTRPERFAGSTSERKSRPGAIDDIRPGRAPGRPPVRKSGSEGKGHIRPDTTSGKLDVRKVRPEDRPYIRPGKTEGKTVTKPVKTGSKGRQTITTQLRLNRFIANSGVCSRRDADEHIKNGFVTVNGKLVTDLGTKVTYDDDVRFKNKKLSAEKKVYILMNKPKDYVTTVEDPHAEHTVLELIGEDCPERVYPVGRLDKATTGVLLLTNDGDLAGKLTHPKYKRKKIYHVFLDNPVTKNDLFKITEGIELDGITVVADAISYADPEDKSQIGIELHSGQNRVIRRMFETLGYKVKKLDRVYFAGLTKKNVQRGKWRFLTDKEVSMLKRGAF
jgi:23S rRNA pseudouridine2605 synthase